MKKLGLLIALAVVSLCTITAQRDETIFNRSGRFGVFATPLVEFSSFGSGLDVAGGGAFAFILDDFMLGFYGLASSDYRDIINTGDIETINLAHGGLWLGYSANQHRVIHPITNVKLGWGAADIDIDRFDRDPFNAGDAVFVVTPELGLEMNVTSFLRIAATGGYRWVNGLDTSVFNRSDFNGFTGTLSVRFGWFGKDRGRYKSRHDW